MTHKGEIQLQEKGEIDENVIFFYCKIIVWIISYGDRVLT